MRPITCETTAYFGGIAKQRVCISCGSSKLPSIGKVDVEGSEGRQAVNEVECIPALQDQLLHQHVVREHRNDGGAPDVHSFHAGSLPHRPGEAVHRAGHAWGVSRQGVTRRGDIVSSETHPL